MADGAILPLRPALYSGVTNGVRHDPWFLATSGSVAGPLQYFPDTRLGSPALYWEQARESLIIWTTG